MTTESLNKAEVADAKAPSAEGMFGLPWLTRDRVNRLVKFGIVGVSGVAVNLIVFEMAYPLLASLSHQTQITGANAAGLVVSIFTNFLLNDLWTWGDREKGTKRHWFGRLFKYYASASVAGGVQLVVTAVSFELVVQHLALEVSLGAPWVDWLAMEPTTVDLGPRIAVLTGIASGMAINFLASHLWAFRDVEVES